MTPISLALMRTTRICRPESWPHLGEQGGTLFGHCDWKTRQPVVFMLPVGFLCVCVCVRSVSEAVGSSPRLAWFAWRLAEGGDTWGEVVLNARAAEAATNDAALAVSTMLTAWLVLFLPFLTDLWWSVHAIVSPVWADLREGWEAHNNEERCWLEAGIFALAFAAWASRILARRAAALWQKAKETHQRWTEQLSSQGRAAYEAAVPVVFHLSFLCGSSLQALQRRLC